MTIQTLDEVRAGLTNVGLEEAIRQLAARGEISNLSLTMNGTGTKWRACFAPCSVFGLSYAEDADPAVALQRALTTMKLKTRKVPVKDRDLVGTIRQDVVEVEPEAYVSAAQADEYLAGIQAKTAAAPDVEDLM